MMDCGMVEHWMVNHQMVSGTEYYFDTGWASIRTNSFKNESDRVPTAYAFG